QAVVAVPQGPKCPQPAGPPGRGLGRRRRGRGDGGVRGHTLTLAAITDGSRRVFGAAAWLREPWHPAPGKESGATAVSALGDRVRRGDGTAQRAVAPGRGRVPRLSEPCCRAPVRRRGGRGRPRPRRPPGRAGPRAPP